MTRGDDEVDEQEWWQAVASLQDAVDAVPGFAGLEGDGTVATLAWKGPVPATVRDALTGLPTGVALRVVDAPYDQRELHEAAARLLDGARRTAAGGGGGAAAPRADGSGLHVEVVVPGGGAAPSAADLSDRAGVPVDVELVPQAPQAFAARRPPRGRRTG